MRYDSFVQAPPPKDRHALVALVVLTAVLGCGVWAWHSSAEAATPLDPPAPAADSMKFSHTNTHHARLACLLCHQREDNSARLKLPGHMPCAGCHGQQFADQSSPICAICHTAPPAAPVKSFPSLRGFNVRFDHARHQRGGARPRQGCVACHKPERRGTALSIPAGSAAHSTCFQCHTPRAQSGGRDISSCGTCHQIGRYARTPEFTQAYRINFSHAEHARKGLGCNDCHTVKAGAAQRRQVSAPVPSQHNAPAGAVSCATCHNNERAFGGDDFSDCKRCHQGDTWHY